MVGSGVHQRLRIRGHFQRRIVAGSAPLSHQILRLSQGVRRHRGDFRGQRTRFVDQRIGFDHPADEAPVQRRIGIDHIAGIEQLRRPRLADDARQDPGAAIAGNDAQLEESDAEFRPIAGDAHVREAGKIASQPDGRPIDCGNQRHAQSVERAQDLVDVVAIAVRDFGRSAAEIAGLVLHRLDIAARAEGSARSGEDHAAHVDIAVDRVAGGGEGIAIARCPERVHAVGTVES